MKIPLGRSGKFVQIDDEDYELVKDYSWHTSSGHDTTYAATAIPMHRMIMKAPIGMEVDHINGDGLDNRRSNLRLVSKSDNLHNSKVRSDSTTGQRGVAIDRTYKPGETWYRVFINYRNKKYDLGRFKTIKAATAARQAKVIELKIDNFR